jgi:hypothetical protein
MPEQPALGFDQAFGVLRQFARGRRQSPLAAERCELCSASLGRQHPHLIELATRQIHCACDACALLFDGIEGARYKRVSRSAQLLNEFAMTDGQWESLLIPINLAFFFRSSIEGRIVALYPSPAGAVESLLPIDAWSEIADSNPALHSLRPDIEALLVNRVGHAHGMTLAEYYIAPIDECFKLVGIIRSNWRGLSGGTEVWSEIGGFFSSLRSVAEPVMGGLNA